MVSNAERWRLVGEILFDLLELHESEDKEVREQSLAEADKNLERLLGMLPDMDENGELFLRDIESSLGAMVKESLD